MHVTAIIAAGGRGLRFGGTLPKQFVLVGGRSLLERSVAIFLTHPEIDEVIVALPVELLDTPPPYLIGRSKPVRIVAGGARRQDSVLNGFKAVDERTDLVVVHDAARPFASAALVSRTLAAAAESGAAVAAVSARDTVKRGMSGAFVTETLPRESIFLAQTPQAFRREVLRDALSLAETGVEATDEAALAERAGHAVRLVEGEPENVKVTTADDLLVAEALAGTSSARTLRRSGEFEIRFRIGTGYDLHRLVEGRALILGGLTIPSDRGALGHSDADVVCHAITDAILGAAGLGDIGLHFPDEDPSWKGASSLDLLARATALVIDKGFAVNDIDVTVVLERPKIREHIAAMRAAVAGALGIPSDHVSIKGKTNEGVDAVGRGEAVAAHAVALIERM
jgi:2-C-methyl-D-erythritol 4-phosphate cytidylyltransferase/2-C-methyl-D-erythritol 2,4-cyclodiphosphate synthase